MSTTLVFYKIPVIGVLVVRVVPGLFPASFTAIIVNVYSV